MIPYWKRVPITSPPVLMELDPSHAQRVYDASLLGIKELVYWYPPDSWRMEDPFDFYEDSLGG